MNWLGFMDMPLQYFYYSFILFVKISLIFVFFYGIYALLKKNRAVSELKQEDYTQRYIEPAQKIAEKSLGSKEQRRLWRGKNKPLAQGAPCLYVLDFDGDIQASGSDELSQTVSYLKEMLREQDKVLLRLKSAGGMVPHYGYAAAQLSRLREAAHLIVAIDHIAASGGYLMACVAHDIVAAPFAIVGSIGVVGVVPSVHPWLKNHGIDVQEHTAGVHKRSLTPWAEQTPEKVARYKEELEQTHALFQDFVRQYRPHLDEQILQTGEYRYARSSTGDGGLVDRIAVSEEVIAEHLQKYHVIFVNHEKKKSLRQRLLPFVSQVTQRFLEWYA